MSASNAPPPKTTANRILLFFLIGFTSTVPLWFINFVVGAFWLIGLLPLVVFAVLIFLFIREKRVSEVKPRLLELFLAALGAFYPSVLVSIVLWLVWWVLYGVAVLFGVEGEQSGAAYRFATTVFGLLSLGLVIFLARMNWRHLLSQLYPQVGNQSAFVQISATGKKWLFKRGVILSIVFFVLLMIYLIVIGSVESSSPVAADFQLGLFLVIIYLFFISISAWLWLREPKIPRGIEVANKAIARLLQPVGYEIQTLAEIINRPGQEAVVSEQMTASVDLVALSKGNSMVIDVMTREESPESANWVTASDFRTAVWYLESILALPEPVEAVFVLVDVIPEDSLLTFADKHDIKVIQLSGEKVVELLAQDMSEPAMQKTAATLFLPLLNGYVNTTSSVEPMLENGGQHG
ncbi:MAG: hypothetical protein GY805_30725 [Chloroflexi bacterium]|nr:hypothetical protein [Chloroflexota bacterium]